MSIDIHLSDEYLGRNLYVEIEEGPDRGIAHVGTLEFYDEHWVTLSPATRADRMRMGEVRHALIRLRTGKPDMLHPVVKVKHLPIDQITSMGEARMSCSAEPQTPLPREVEEKILSRYSKGQ